MRRRVRKPHKPKLSDRIRRAIEMPGLRRAERNQRLAFVAVLLAVAIYFIVSPFVSALIGTGKKGATVKGITPAAARAAIKERR